jgi:uncharacterized membrane protein
MKHASAASRRMRLWNGLRARPRLLGSVLAGVAVYVALVLALDLPGATATLIAWNAGVVLNLALSLRLARETDLEAIKRRAVTQDDGRIAILGVVVLGVAAVLLAVGTQLSQARALHGTERAMHVVLALLTVVTTWLFMQTVFALHYAHDFYLARIHGAPDPLGFPGTRDPLYPDFFHFSCVIGVAGQTADISFTGSALRAVGTVHCVFAFFFNATLLALAINVAAGVLT